jgi:glucose/arabinose dehydrogenase
MARSRDLADAQPTRRCARRIVRSPTVLISTLLALTSLGLAADTPVLTGTAAMGGWQTDAPGVRRHIRVSDLPAPYATPSVGRPPTTTSQPATAHPLVPPGFTVSRLTTGLASPRVLRVAPNGDIFVAETSGNRIRVLRTATGGAIDRIEVFATGLDRPFGMAFHPLGGEPQWLYVANNNAVVRYAYRNGDLRARGAAETIVAELAPTTRGHSTRDLAFTADGRRLLVSVGSESNVAEQMPRKSAAELRSHEQQLGTGAAWDSELRRAAVQAFDAQGRPESRLYATGIRNSVGMTVHSQTGDLWCATNERDGLGDDLVPDYVTRVRSGGFYGWPWYYLGAIEDPRHRGARPDLADKVSVPDVLIQSHSAALGVVEYRGRGGSAAFPAAYDGDLFVALHGSWNRSDRTGYKVVRIPLRDGIPGGEYEDFMTGFVIDTNQVWGRPVGVAVARDGALLVSDDGSGSIWRVAPTR